MLFTPLDSILSSSVRVRVLRTLADAPHAMSGREVARQAGAGRSMTRRVLAELVDLGIVLVEPTTAQHLYRLNAGNQLVRDGILPLFRAERQRAADVFAELRRILSAAGEPLTAYVFGSAARGDDVPGSDFDLLVITAEAETAEVVHDLLSGHAPELRARFGIVLSPVVMDERTSRRQATSGDGFFSDVAREGRKLQGADLEDLLHGKTRAA
jgi:predicted nucleotidyltransferase